MMHPRGLIRTTATILVFGLASVTGSQADQKVQEPGSGKQSDKATQVQQQDQQQRPLKQNRQQRPAARNRQEQPSTQDRQQRSPAKDRQVRSNRQEPVQRQSQSERPATQRQRSKAAVRSSQQRTPVQNRTTTPTRRVAQAPTKQRASATRVEHQRVWPRYRASNWSSQHRTWTQRGGYRGYRIPSRQFTIYFGRPHRFYLSSYQIRIVGAYPQFYMDGFWFTILDPVPEYWGDDWYHTDYVTIVESHGGYYLLSEEYPSAQLAISVHL